MKRWGVRSKVSGIGFWVSDSEFLLYAQALIHTPLAVYALALCDNRLRALSLCVRSVDALAQCACVCAGAAGLSGPSSILEGRDKSP